ncbi:MAG TPA: serine/threonine-protein kinase [Bryobacteraceae bacterium]|nr:serine/threonine-protein kinase [Bryobacteraceae bacterium]
MPNQAISREQDLFCEGIGLTPTERASWLHQVCGDDHTLRQRIERLLNAHGEAEKGAIPESWAEPLDDLPAFIDGYRILRIAGEGGMGVVYEAWQEEPVQRRVAIKAVRPGMDTRQILARFRAERQSLAAMDHPYVAKIFDAGQTTAGRPYFVMEFVDGIPLLAYCERHRLAARERIGLFLLVCQAVQHAHHKGVIHRDLKPGNVLVTSDVGTPLPKIIDFGIARAVSSDGRAGLTLTHAGLLAGTPAYMSPEQAGRNGLDIDTRSDVYSLGVILYELLTTTLPVDPESTSLPEYLHLLAKGELKVYRPSTRAPGIAADLDAVVMKALEPNRERRYATPTALAEDLQRYLEGMPVTARPPSLAYVTRKFVRRHRAGVVAAAVAAIAITGGATAAGVGLMRAQAAEAAARQDAAAAREVSEFLARLFTTSDPNVAPGTPITVRQVLDHGTRRVQNELNDMPEAKSMLLGTLSHVHESLGAYRQARDLAEQALATRAGVEDLQTANALVLLARANQRLSDFERARAAAERALAIRARLLGENHLDVGIALNNLGSILGQIERFDEAIAAHRRALAIQQKLRGPEHIASYNSWRGLGIVYDRQGKYQEALGCFENNLAIAKKRFGESHTVVADALENTSRMLLQLKRPVEAQILSEKALAIQRKRLAPDHPELAFSLHGLAATLRDQGKLAEAAALYGEALRIRAAKIGPANLRTAESLKSLGLVRIRMGKVEEGQRLIAQALPTLEKTYGPTHSDVLECHRETALALVAAGRYQDAVPHLKRVTAPNTPEHLRVNLQSAAFDKMRASPAFRDLHP